MSSEENQRGVFPGSEFFTTLKKIAKKATQEIQDINRSLTQPSAVHEIQDGNLWTELHIGYNTAYNQSIGLNETLSSQESIYNSLESFNSLIKWIGIETNRIEKQLQQFGYEPDKNTNYEYNLPLTPQQQQIYEQQIQQNKQNQQMDIDNNNTNNNNNKNMDIDDEKSNEINDKNEHNDIENVKKVQEADINEKKK
eukprot:538591_1